MRRKCVSDCDEAPVVCAKHFNEQHIWRQEAERKLKEAERQHDLDQAQAQGQHDAYEREREEMKKQRDELKRELEEFRNVENKLPYLWTLPRA